MGRVRVDTETFPILLMIALAMVTLSSTCSLSSTQWTAEFAGFVDEDVFTSSSTDRLKLESERLEEEEREEHKGRRKRRPCRGPSSLLRAFVL